MATTNITPIPYNGGTLNLANRKDIATVWLSGSKFVTFYAQSNPNLVYAHVVNTTGLNGGTASASNGPQFAFSASSGRVRAWKLSANRLLVLLGSDLRVMEVDSSDNIVMKNAILANFFAASIWRGANPTSTNSFSVETVAEAHGGAGISVQYAAENSVWIAAKISIGGNYDTYTTNGNAAYATSGLSFITYDSTTDVLSVSRVSNLASAPFTAPPNPGTGQGVDLLIDTRFATIPNSNKVLIYCIGCNSSTSSAARGTVLSPRLMWAAVLTPAGTIDYVLTATGNPSSNWTSDTPFITAMCAVSETVFLGFTDARSHLVYDRATTEAWSANRVTFAVSGHNMMVTSAQMVDDTYALITFTDPVESTTAGSSRLSRNFRATNQYYRIVRYVDQTFSEVSPATEDYASFSLGVPMMIDQNQVERISPTTLVSYTKANATATDPKVTIRSIYGS